MGYPIGQAKHNKVEFIGGNGCFLHGNCLTCPYGDCVRDKVLMMRERNKIFNGGVIQKRMEVER